MKNDTSKKVYSKYGFFKSLFSCVLCVLVIYLIFTPIFYFYNKLLLSGWVYILASILQLLAVVASGICLSAGSRSVLSNEQVRGVRIGILCGLVLMFVLHIEGVPDRWYGTMTSSLRIYDTFSDNLFVVVLIERLFDNYFVTSFFVCAAAAYFKPLKK